MAKIQHFHGGAAQARPFPLRGGKPDLRPNRVNIDTAAVLGGPLTAAVFDDSKAAPIGFLQET